jgi:hypothetical protein
LVLGRLSAAIHALAHPSAHRKLLDGGCGFFIGKKGHAGAEKPPGGPAVDKANGIYCFAIGFVGNGAGRFILIAGIETSIGDAEEQIN